MRTLAVLAAAVLAGGLAAEPAAAAPTVWQGDLFITSATSACTSFDINTASFFRAVYRPDIAPPPAGQAKEALSIVSGRSAVILEASTLRGKGAPSSIVIGSEAEFFGPETISVNLTITPSTIKATTPAVEISGSINNFFNISGCTVGVVGALGLRP
jgi:hypothetical protein